MNRPSCLHNTLLICVHTRTCTRTRSTNRKPKVLISLDQCFSTGLAIKEPLKAVNPYIPSEGAHRDPQVQSMGFLGGPDYKLKSKGEASSPREQRQRSLFLHHPPEGEAGPHKRSGGARLQSGQPNSELRGQQRLRAAGAGGRRPFPRLWITLDCRNKTSRTRLPPLSSLGPVLPMPALGTQAVGQSQLSREARVVKQHPRAFSFPGENDPNTSHGVKIKPRLRPERLALLRLPNTLHRFQK